MERCVKYVRGSVCGFPPVSDLLGSATLPGAGRSVENYVVVLVEKSFRLGAVAVEGSRVSDESSDCGVKR